MLMMDADADDADDADDAEAADKGGEPDTGLQAPT